MRTRAFLAIALVLLPAGLNAQRMPRIGRHRPGGATPIGPQPPAVARALSYKRMRVSFESYPLISYVQSPGAGGSVVAQHRTSYGAGTRADYRVMRRLSATLDMTSTFPGGSATTETAELGIRLRPERNDRKVYPFVDVRGGYVHAFDSFLQASDFIDGSTGQQAYGARYSQGYGGVGGAGLEFGLTRRFAMTTAASVMRSRMTPYSIHNAPPSNGSYSMTTYRFTLGIRYNPVRVIRASGTESP